MLGLIDLCTRLHVIDSNHHLPGGDAVSLADEKFLNASGKLTGDGEMIPLDAPIRLNQPFRQPAVQKTSGEEKKAARKQSRQPDHHNN